MRNIGLIGRKRSGKDTAANWLVAHRLYTRVAFADPLKEHVLTINPYVPTGYGVTVRLTSLVADVGWEYAKDNYPEVRRLLQVVGQAQREQDEDYWTNIARRKLNAAESWNLPVVVTDVRYPNEADMLRARGFHLVRILRPTTQDESAGQHSSEIALDAYEADTTILNDGTIDDLHQRIARV